MFYCFKFSGYIRFFINVLIETNVETNVNICNVFNFFLCLSKLGIQWVASKVYTLWGSFTFHATQCNLRFDKPHKKSEMHFLIYCRLPAATCSCVQQFYISFLVLLGKYQPYLLPSPTPSSVALLLLCLVPLLVLLYHNYR